MQPFFCPFTCLLDINNKVTVAENTRQYVSGRASTTSDCYIRGAPTLPDKKLSIHAEPTTMPHPIMKWQIPFN
jgi:hypothetical protein